MNRTDEIIEIFQSINIPRDITKQIMNKEKNEILKDSYMEWDSIKRWNQSYRKILFFEKFNRESLLKDIVHINGNFNTLQYHTDCYKRLKKESEQSANFILSFRF